MTSTSRIASICLVAMLSALPAGAQDSRAAELAAQQADKSKNLKPNTPSTPERLLERVENHFNDPNTIYVTFGGVYPSGGFSSGLAGRRAIGRARFDARGLYSIRNYKLAEASMGFPDLASNRVEIDTRVRWADATEVPFYGVGNDTDKDNRVNYGLRALDAGASFALRPVPWYRIGGTIALRRMEDRQGEGARPSIETVATPSTAPALFTETRYTQTIAFTSIDWRTSPGYSRKGGFYSIALNDFRDADDRFGFHRVDAEVQQLLPLLKEHWILAFRGVVRTTDVDDQQLVPYYLLPSLSGGRLHRGYSDFRFQDRHMMLLSGEYRWTPSRVLDMALFVDTGKVAHERRDLDFNHLKTAYGIGFRIHGPALTPLRLDIARGSEGIRFHLTGGIPF